MEALTSSAARSVIDRFGDREPLTQSLGYAAALQERGFSCLLAGPAIVLLKPGEGGVLAQMQRPRALDLGLLEVIAARTGVTRLLVEPALRVVLIDRDERRATLHFGPAEVERSRERLLALGWTPAPPSAHTRTQVIDLAGGLDETVAGFSAIARRNTRIALARPVTYDARPLDAIAPEEYAEVEALDVEVRAEKPYLRDDRALRTSLVRGFGPRGFLITARAADRLLGVIYLLLHDRVATYFAAFSCAEARPLRVPTGLVFRALACAVAEGCDLFDLCGLWDPRHPDRYPRWRGFTRFKQRFGGVSVDFGPSFDARLPV
ncbi:MAG: GNAT family N-acetyltransferase [Nannocystaceae bacterium]|nr:GNAT family N-acetyltransferase [Myxococcales bacterium]